jgi:hypothetical protein
MQIRHQHVKFPAVPGGIASMNAHLTIRTMSMECAGLINMVTIPIVDRTIPAVQMDAIHPRDYAYKCLIWPSIEMMIEGDQCRI